MQVSFCLRVTNGFRRLEAYKETKFVHSGLKFPDTANGKDILSNEDFKKRITLCKGPDFPTLEEYSDVLKFFGFNKYLVYEEDPKWQTTSETNVTKESGFGFLMKLGGAKAVRPFLCVWLYHVPSKQLMVEHNFEMNFSKAQIATSQISIMKLVLKPGKFEPANGPLPKRPHDLQECKEHCELMQKILALDVAAAVDYHSECCLQCRKWDSKEAFAEGFAKCLKPFGEDVADGSAMAKKNAPKSCIIL